MQPFQHIKVSKYNNNNNNTLQHTPSVTLLLLSRLSFKLGFGHLSPMHYTFMVPRSPPWFDRLSYMSYLHLLIPTLDEPANQGSRM